MKIILFAFLLCSLCDATLQHLKAKLAQHEAGGPLAPLKEKVLAETGVKSPALVQVEGSLCCDPATEPYDYVQFTLLEAEAKAEAKAEQRPWCYGHACCPTTGEWVCAPYWGAPLSCSGGVKCHSPLPCCSPLQKPGTFTNPPCAVGTTEICCRDGTWGCGNSVTGVYTCGGVQTTGPFSVQCWDCSTAVCSNIALTCPVSQQYYQWGSCCKSCVDCGEGYAAIAGSDCSVSNTCPSGSSCYSGTNLLPGGVYSSFGLCCKNTITRLPGSPPPKPGTISL
jgi:hypothetical protein